MLYLIQDNIFKERNSINLIKALERLKREYEVVKLIPFTYTFDNWDSDRKDIFAFGALKLADISKQKQWSPGVLMTPNHNYEIYKQFYKDHLLNFDSVIQTVDTPIDFQNNRFKFIRPCEDSKAFDGQLFTEESWQLFLNFWKESGWQTKLTPKTKIQVASLKKTQKEYRFYIVGGEVITGSQYKLNDKVIYDENIDPGAIDFCKEMIKLFQLADSFVMDICLYNDEWKIVECGCINCAGFYNSDIQKLIIAIDDRYNTRLQ